MTSHSQVKTDLIRVICKPWKVYKSRKGSIVKDAIKINNHDTFPSNPTYI